MTVWRARMLGSRDSSGGWWSCRAVILAATRATRRQPGRLMETSPTHRLANFLALNRTVAVVLLTVLLFGLGEELWSQFMPAYLDALHSEEAREAGRSGHVGWMVLWLVGIYGFLLNLFEGVCYISGGHLTARL